MFNEGSRRLDALDALRKNLTDKKLLCPALLGAAILTLGLADPALAAEEGHGLPWGDFAWRVVNIIVFVAILWHFVGKLAVNFFRGRRKGIQDGIDDLTARREDAKQKLLEIQERVANLEEERKAILDESRAQAEALRADIVARAHEQAGQIIAMAHATAESEGQRVLQQMREAIADELVDATREHLVKSLNKKQHEKLINNSLKKVVLS